MQQPITADIYVDGNYIGTGSGSTQVLQGEHQIYCTTPGWSDYWGCYINFDEFYGGWGNGDYQNIQTDTTTWAYYG